MPSYIVKKILSTKDGSGLGANPVVVTATNPEEAKQQGAAQLGCSPSVVSVEPFPNLAWDRLRG